MYFNPQWLAYPCIIWAVINLALAVNAVLSTIGRSDIGPMIGIAVAIHCVFHTLAASGFAFLFWNAFRK